MTNTPRDNLIKTRELLATEGKWRQGALLDENGCMCLLGAIGVATGVIDPDTFNDAPVDNSAATYEGLSDAEEVTLVRKAIYQDAVYDQTTFVFQWNDKTDRTHAEVINILDKAIALA